MVVEERFGAYSHSAFDMTADDRVEPRKTPTQERSQATFDAIVEAAARILRDRGTDGLTTNHIAEVAGVSVGSLYQYFPNKEAIVAQLVEYELARDLAHVQASLDALTDVPIADAIDLLYQGIVAHATSTQELHQELLPLVPAVDRDRLVRAQVAELHESVVDFFWARREELASRFRDDRDQLERSLWVLSQMVEAVINASKVERPELLGSDTLERIARGAFRRELLPH